MNDLLYEPLKYYDTVGRATHAENTEALFDSLLKSSSVDAEANRAAVRAYQKETNAAEKVGKRLSGYKWARAGLILLAVLGGILLLAGIGGGDVLSVVLGPVLLAVGILLLVKKINPLVRSTEAVKAEHEEKAARHREEAAALLSPLHALFTEEIPFRLMEKTLPEITFTEKFTKENEREFIKKYDFPTAYNGDISLLDTVSGTLLGNPFLFGRRLVHRLGTETYHGSLTISWTEHYRDSEGRSRTRSRTQTLHASVVKPKPFYHTENYLCYGCQAAPDLSFSREPKHVERLSDVFVEQRVRSGKRKLARKAKKAVTSGGTFQEMSNSEFDVLFGATNRDHEVQFRLMYTPLAQRNTVSLLRNEDGYGDDFHFIKAKRYNIIKSEHAQAWEMNTSPAHYYSFDVDEAKRKFCDFNNRYFQSVFFDFAPLLCVPAYLEEPSFSLEPPEPYESRFTEYEHEVMANVIGAGAFAPAGAATSSILKTRHLRSGNDSDTVEVTAHAYFAEDRLDYVSVWGGDGALHAVPVPWVEYIPASLASQMEVVKETPESVGVRFHGLSARKIV